MSIWATTLKQPWASLIALGYQSTFPRSWRTSHRGPMAIHSSETESRIALLTVMQNLRANLEDQDMFDEFVGRVATDKDRERLGNFRRAGVAERWGKLAESSLDLPSGMVLATCELVDIVPTNSLRSGTDLERQAGQMAPGRWTWILEDVRALKEPVAARGRRIMWEWEGARS